MKVRVKRLVNSGDEHFTEVVRHSFWAMMLLIATTAIQFIFDLVLTRTFLAHDAGIFYLCFSVLMMLALLGRLGMDRAVVQFIPPLLKKNPGAAAGVNRTATQLSLLFTLPLAMTLFLFAPQIADYVFHSSELTPYLRIFAVAIPALALNYVYSGTLRALKKTQSALSIQRTTMYLLGIAAVLLADNTFGLKGAMIGFVVAVFASTIIGLYYIRRYHPPYKTIVPFSKRRMFLTAAPLLLVVFATQMNGQASVLLLGIFGTNTDVAVFNIALKISLLMGLILTAINVIAATKISELYAENRKDELALMLSKISALGTLCGLPLFLILSLFPGIWLGFFGNVFTTGATALIILSFGQLISVSVGSGDYALAMTKHENALAGAVGFSLILNVILGIVLIPHYGILGAGIATATTVIVSNVIMALLVRGYLGVWLLPFRFLKLWFGKLV